MQPAEYQRLLQESDSDNALLFTDRVEPARPPTYYDEGPFDPPSSEDEEGEELLQKNPTSPGSAERGGRGFAGPGSGVGDTPNGRPQSLRYLIIALGSLVLIAILIGSIAAFTYSGSTETPWGYQRMTLDHITNGTFRPDMQDLHWVPEAGDGVFSVLQDGKIRLVDLKTNSTTDLVAQTDIKNERGSQIIFDSWKLSPDMKYILVKTDHQKQWRHSSFGNYYIHQIDSKSTWPMVQTTYPPIISYATWSPTGESIAYVSSNDIYVLPIAAPSTSPIRVTSSGNTSLFHGVPDWVYEEEVLSTDYALWWSPNSTKLAFLRLDETMVDDYSYPVYNPTPDAKTVVPYPSSVTMKYPKPGYPNPLASVHVFELDRYNENLISGNYSAESSTLELTWEGKLAANTSVIFEVAWVGDTALIVKEVDRAGDEGSVVLFDLQADDLTARVNGRVVRILGKNGEEGDNGWIESRQEIYPLPSSVSHQGTPGYLDIVPNHEGYDHIALFNPVDSGTPRFLTTGKWEVTGGVLAVDVDRGLVYFQAASPSSIERNIYAIHLPASAETEAVSEPTALSDNSKLSFHQASFSPGAGFYLLTYTGPGVPWQKVVHVGNEEKNYLLTDNANLNQTLTRFESPVIIHSTIESEGYELNAKELRPKKMDDSGKIKYPVLFHVYGGPSSQIVNAQFARDWNYLLATNHKYIVVQVDGRGTGCKGRELRNTVKNNLGFWEVRDQINAARIWAAKPYVDTKRIGIWGWSYGGFTSAKVAEANEGVHSLAISVAPVTSWRLYDSVYTERYMDLPDVNPGGYLNASISNVTGFDNVDFLLAHGSGDDNVHYANTARLLDMLTQSQVRRFRFRMFTDSDHSISTRGAYHEVYQFLTDFLVEKWGKGERKRGW